jgi:AraC family transcriptional regulator of adaptative response / DNA-3-methyladenine glycosylase II
VTLDPDRCWRAAEARDARFDGRFFTAVRTTGVYCRPICPVSPPKRRNVTFFACAAAAEAAGYRPCMRCRPDAAPGTPAWLGSSAVVSRALRLIEGQALDDADVERFAARLGLGARQLRRLFARHLGASPVEIARVRRVHFARSLVDETDLPMTEIALAAGFRSVRQFNHAVRATFRAAPTVLRRKRRAGSRSAEGLVVRLPFRPPLDWDALLAFLAARAVPGVEAVGGGMYRRTVAVGGGVARNGSASAAGDVGTIAVSRGGPAHLCLRVALPTTRGLLAAVDRVRRVFDLAADPHAIGRQLRRSARLRPLIRARPGLRVPGAWDPFELAVRAVLGQQVTVRGATTLAGRLVEGWGRPIAGGEPGLTHLFPTPAALAGADVERIGLPRARAATIRALAAAVASGALVLDGAAGLDDAIARLAALPGVGPWTAHYVAMRALGEPDAFPAGDLGVRRALGNGRGPLTASAAERAAEAWRPWRAYAVFHLWNEEGPR